jgi:sarcosine oxidase gamma subunit
MIRLERTARSIAACCAEASALEGLAVTPDARMLRVAPDEVMLVGDPGRGDVLVEAARRALGPTAIVEDVTDGWTSWTMEGDGLERAFSFLSPLELPAEGFVQGDVARVPVKAIASPGRLELLVPSMWSEHLRDRILRRCAPDGVVEVEA